MTKWEFDIVKEINRTATVKKDKAVECPFCKSDNVQCIGIDIAGEEIKKKTLLNILFPHEEVDNDIYRWHCQKCGSVFEKGLNKDNSLMVKGILTIVILLCIYGIMLSL